MKEVGDHISSTEVELGMLALTEEEIREMIEFDDMLSRYQTCEELNLPSITPLDMRQRKLWRMLRKGYKRWQDEARMKY